MRGNVFSGRWGSLLVLLLAGGVAAAVALAPMGGECGFRHLLGAPCPGCGMTRSLVALCRGDAAASWRFHPLGPPLAAAALLAIGLAVHEGFTGRPTFRLPAARWGAGAALVLLVLGAAVWVARVVVHPEWSPDPIRPGSPAARLLE